MAFGRTGQSKSRCITHLATFLYQIQSTDSAEQPEILGVRRQSRRFGIAARAARRRPTKAAALAAALLNRASLLFFDPQPEFDFLESADHKAPDARTEKRGEVRPQIEPP